MTMYLSAMFILGPTSPATVTWAGWLHLCALINQGTGKGLYVVLRIL